eukprot:7844369-Pyramimonas_sp.AAC.1
MASQEPMFKPAARDTSSPQKRVIGSAAVSAQVSVQMSEYPSSGQLWRFDAVPQRALSEYVAAGRIQGGQRQGACRSIPCVTGVVNMRASGDLSDWCPPLLVPARPRPLLRLLVLLACEGPDPEARHDVALPRHVVALL